MLRPLLLVVNKTPISEPISIRTLSPIKIPVVKVIELKVNKVIPKKEEPENNNPTRPITKKAEIRLPKTFNM